MDLPSSLIKRNIAVPPTREATSRIHTFSSNLVVAQDANLIQVASFLDTTLAIYSITKNASACQTRRHPRWLLAATCAFLIGFATIHLTDIGASKFFTKHLNHLFSCYFPVSFFCELILVITFKTVRCFREVPGKGRAAIELNVEYAGRPFWGTPQWPSRIYTPYTPLMGWAICRAFTSVFDANSRVVFSVAD